MKRYLVFMGSIFYPEGGMDDFFVDVDSVYSGAELVTSKIMEAFPLYGGVYTEAEWNEQHWDMNWAHIYDTETREIVWKMGGDYRAGR